jgi:uncharacterized repeat protein (TIGR03803 family)
MAMSIASLSFAAAAVAAPIETVLHSFDGASAGAFPFAGLVADKHGALYGTTAYGGHGADPGASGTHVGDGTVFKLTPPRDGQTAWTQTVLYRFCQEPGCGDGSRPYAGLLIDDDGALYGTTYSGGSVGHLDAGGGTVFKLTAPRDGQTAWTHTVLYRFQGGSDGNGPSGDLKSDGQGGLYGTTSSGGVNGADHEGQGTVFRLIPPPYGQTAWTESVIYRFQGGGDGSHPDGDLMIDDQGALYGTTGRGGSTDAKGLGFGTVFKLAPPAKGETAWKETVLYRFQGGGDGANPEAELVADDHGVLYGVTYAGGIGGGLDGKSGNGTIFKLTPPAKGEPAWTHTVLYRFKGGDDGGVPALRTSLLVDKAGALYGTTTSGGLVGEAGAGSSGYGTIFKLAPPAGDQTAWTETVLHRFRAGDDGAYPDSGLFSDNQGALYGTTQGGGASNAGTVFKLNLCPESKQGVPREKEGDECSGFLSSEASFPAPDANKTHFVYRPQDKSLPTEPVPDLGGRSHRLTAELETPPSGVEGVIVSQGGSAGGYSLFVKDGKLAYEGNSFGKIEKPLVSRWPLPPGKVRVGFEFVADQGPLATLVALLGRKNKNSGTARLLIDGVEVARAHFTKFGDFGDAHNEPLAIGKDIGSPVSPRYSAPFPFKGKIDKIEIDLEPTGATSR